MLTSNINDIYESLLQEVCAQHWQESQTLDFKRAFPGGTDREKSEALKDVCSFANADGGDLVYGITDIDGKADSISPVPKEGFDAIQRRLLQSIDSSIEPRISGIQARICEVAGGYVYVLRIPASVNGPHRFSVGGNQRFVMRNKTHTVDMSIDQLREAFGAASTQYEKLKAFRAQRIADIAARVNTYPLRPGPVLVVHLLPIASFARKTLVDIAAVRSVAGTFALDNWSGVRFHPNLDGLALLSYGRDESDGSLYHAQIYRNGAYEVVSHAGLLVDPEKPIIPGSAVAKWIGQAVSAYSKGADALGVAGQVAIGVSLLDIADYKLATMRYDEPAAGPHKQIVIPEVLIDELRPGLNVAEATAPVLDILAQAFGLIRFPEQTERL